MPFILYFARLPKKSSFETYTLRNIRSVEKLETLAACHYADPSESYLFKITFSRKTSREVAIIFAKDCQTGVQIISSNFSTITASFMQLILISY